MKKLLLSILLLYTCQAADAQKYVFFLHNMFLELKPLGEKHPEYGRVEYNEVLAAYRKRGFTVLSEIRPQGTDGKEYAKKIARQADSLVKAGVPPSHITVVGTSKGGYIAMQVSSMLHNSSVNYVFIGCCYKSMLAEDPSLNVCGNILSIYEESDNTETCNTIKEASKCNIPHYKELLLHTGMKHGFLYKANKEWLEPSMKWADGTYN